MLLLHLDTQTKTIQNVELKKNMSTTEEVK